jgi:hypothetical protein
MTRSRSLFSLLLVATLGSAAVAAPIGTAAGFVVNGHGKEAYSGFSVSSAGDVNGDGLDDILIGAPSKRGNGQAFVVFGQATRPASMSLSDVAAGRGGFAINGSGAERAGFSVAAAGDVNGDGFDDLLIGAPFSDPATGRDAGRSYVVFGKASTAAVTLASVARGQGGFAINGEARGGQSGFSVAAAGDVNGDDLADLLLGAPFHSNRTGRAYVVFGKRSAGAVNLRDVAANRGGFAINSEGPNQRAGWAVSGAGDVNGDGLTDLVVSSPWQGGLGQGRSYVVFGRRSAGAVNLRDVARGQGGFAINGSQLFSYTGQSVAAAGDVNGDGFDDLLIGAPLGSSATAYNGGQVYVVHGKSSTAAVNLATLSKGGGGGFVVNGQARADNAGSSIAGIGDINGDGLDDVLIGAPKANNGRRIDPGKAYVVYGKKSATPVNLSPSSRHYVGENGFDYLGSSVALAGDVNGDGLPDLVVGAIGARIDPRKAKQFHQGKTYVILGGR